jgi:hypothetical protein
VIKDLEEPRNDGLGKLAPEEDIRWNIEIVTQRKVLVDRFDTEPLGFLGGFDADGMPIYKDATFVDVTDSR